MDAKEQQNENAIANEWLWRGRTEKALETLKEVVGNADGGLVKQVNSIENLLSRQTGRMALFAGIGTFAGSIVSSVIVAALLKLLVK